MNSDRKTTCGFTLIEVLIASTILFASLAVISESYRASMMASDKAAKTAEMLTPLPLILGYVKNKLLETPDELVEGQGEVLGVRFTFEARSARFGAPARRIDPDSGQLMVYQPRFRLYDVQLDLSRGTMRRAFTYQELAWARAEN
jgi:prepilin-type N-terminal cleavage/methylation domain-containing protein